jgi:predicted RNase H-like nuclease (RuvC/YqgF family)
LKEARTEQIKTRLDVTEERAAAIAARWADLEAPIRRVHVESMALWRQMQSIVQDGSPEKEKSRKIKPLYDQYMDLRKELSAARQRLYHELPAMGETPIQQARTLFLMEEMERKERSGLRARARKRERGGAEEK